MSTQPPSGGNGIRLPRDWSSMRDLRKARGLSQAQVGELSGVSERTVRAIESGAVGRPQHESLRRIAEVLAYGTGHQKRLVDSWTRASNSRSSEQIGIPDWQTFFQRLRLRTPAEGGRPVSSISEAKIGSDRRLLERWHRQVYDSMSADGPPALWNLTGGLPLDVSTVRLDVRAGGVLDDFFVNGDIGAFAIRPYPHVARNGPFLLEYSFDFSQTARAELPVEREWMIGFHEAHSVATILLRFTDSWPRRLWTVQGPTATSIEKIADLELAVDGSVQTTVLDFVGVFGIQWEWGDEGS